jgi:hypothetical protein
MKNLILLSLLVSSLSSLSVAASINNDFALKELTSENTLVVNKAIDKGYAKKVHFQDGKIKAWADVDAKRLFCALENSRDKKERMIIKKDATFSFDNNSYVRTSNYIGIRIWHNHWFWGKDNAVVQSITCNNTAKFFNEDIDETITYKMFKREVADYLSIK